MHYIEIIASLAALLILGTISILAIAMVRVSPTDIPTVVNEAGAIVCRLMELLLRHSPGDGSKDIIHPGDRDSTPHDPQGSEIGGGEEK